MPAGHGGLVLLPQGFFCVIFVSFVGMSPGLSQGMDKARLPKEMAMCCFKVPAAAAGVGQRDRRWCDTPPVTWNGKLDSDSPTSPHTSKMRPQHKETLPFFERFTNVTWKNQLMELKLLSNRAAIS